MIKDADEPHPVLHVLPSTMPPVHILADFPSLCSTSLSETPNTTLAFMTRVLEALEVRPSVASSTFLSILNAVSTAVGLTYNSWKTGRERERERERCLKKNQNAPRPSEHPPVRGGGNVKTFRWDQRLQIQNLFMAFKRVSLMVVTLDQQYNVEEKPTVILYAYINHHAQPPIITGHNHSST